MNWLCTILLILSTAQPQPSYNHTRVIVYWVQPEGEQLSYLEQTQTLQDLQTAVDFWSDLSPITTTLDIVPSGVVTSSADIYEYPYSIKYGRSLPENAFFVFIFDNSESRRKFHNDAVGLSGLDAIYVLGSSGSGTHAHELGHQLYNLPHQYNQPADIMGLYPEYSLFIHQIGCASLSVMGHPCTYYYLPAIMRA